MRGRVPVPPIAQQSRAAGDVVGRSSRIRALSLFFCPQTGQSWQQPRNEALPVQRGELQSAGSCLPAGVAPHRAADGRLRPRPSLDNHPNGEQFLPLAASLCGRRTRSPSAYSREAWERRSPPWPGGLTQRWAICLSACLSLLASKASSALGLLCAEGMK